MPQTTDSLTCPACGGAFVPPQGLSRCFCPLCGKPVDVAQARMLDQTIREALETARVAQEAAEQARRAAAEAAAAAAESWRQVAQTETSIAGGSAGQSTAEGSSATTAPAAQSRPAEAPQPAATPRPQPAEAPQPAATPRPQPQPVTYRRNVTVRDSATGRGLFVVTIPSNWKVLDTSLRRTNSASRPYRPYARLNDESKNGITLRTDDAGMQMSAGMKAVMATYGASLASVDRTNYAPMPNPIRLADRFVMDIVSRVGGTDLCLAREWGSPDLASRCREGERMFHELARSSGGALLKDPMAAEVVRIYEFVLNGERRSSAVYVRLYAIKDASGVDLMPVGLAGSLGSAIGGLFSRKKPTGANGSGNVADGPIRTASAPAWCTTDFDEYAKGGSIYWDVNGFATLDAPTKDFDSLFDSVFIPLVRSLELHDDVVSLANAAGRQQAAAMQQATNNTVAQMNRQTQAALAADRQRQAAFDAQLASWHAQSDAHHAAFRERTNAQFNTSGGGSAAPDFSEAIRGVNTFVTSDGREVELDVSADRAYENQAGDVIGGSGGFDPGADWTEIPRA